MMLAILQDVAESTSRQSVWDFLAAGGPVMVPLGLCSVVAVALTMERILRLRLSSVLPPTVQEPIDLAVRGERARALQLAEGVDAPAARILAAGLRRDSLPLLDIERAMEDQAAKESDAMRSRIRALAVIAAIAPLLGLLGTVLGLNEAFHRVVRAGMGKPEQLAAGIEEALITTIVGLCLAIPLMLVASLLQGKVRRMMREVDQRMMPVVDAIVAERRRGDAA
ncbi:MAG: MotA/TolQ/ExbB proton channel family protein [Planctomycetota bacterium]